MWVSLFLLAPAVLHHIPGAAEGRGQGEGTVSDGPPASTLRDAPGNELPARLFPASCTQPSPSSTYLIVPWHRRGLWQGRAPPSTTTFHQCLRAPSRSATTSACFPMCWHTSLLCSEDAVLGELPGPPKEAEPESSPLHGHYSPSATKHCVPNLTNEPGSSYASPRGSYATGGGCYPARGLACLLLVVQTLGTGWSSISSGSLLCHLSPSLILQGVAQPAHLLPASFP